MTNLAHLKNDPLHPKMERAALFAGYLDGAKFHTFRCAGVDDAMDYARRKSWAVEDVVWEGDLIVVSVVPPESIRRSKPDEYAIVRRYQDANDEHIIHPVGVLR